MVCWLPGYSSSLPASTAAVLSDRPEAIPRKVQVLVQDTGDDVSWEREAFKQAWSSTIVKVEPLPAGGERLTMALPIDGTSPYLLQRVTVENTTAALRASGDARPGQPASIEIVAGPRDRLRIVRNQRTYGVVSLFGYGVGILDLNALETNDAPDKPSGWKPLQEKIAFTRASIEPDDSLPSSWDVAEIPDLTFSPDAAIFAGAAGPAVFALDAPRGILKVQVGPQPLPDGGATLAAQRDVGLVFRGTLGAEVYDHPRLAALRAKFKALAGREPFGRFNTIAPYSWSISDKANTPVAPKSPYGQRGSMANNPVQRDYAFVAGNEYGLIAFHRLAEQRDEEEPVRVRAIDVLPLVSARGDVHAPRLPRRRAISEEGDIPRRSSRRKVAGSFTSTR